MAMLCIEIVTREQRMAGRQRKLGIANLSAVALACLSMLASKFLLEFLYVRHVLCATACALIRNEIFDRDHRDQHFLDRKRHSLTICGFKLDAVDSSDNVDASWAIANLEDDPFGRKISFRNALHGSPEGWAK